VNSEIRLWAGTPTGWGQTPVKQMIFGLPPIADLTCGLVGGGIDLPHYLLAVVSVRTRRPGFLSRDCKPHACRHMHVRG
jgi:hypothetical protein